MQLELRLEQAIVDLLQWKWEDALKLANSVMNANPVDPEITIGFLDRPFLTSGGMMGTASQIVATSAYNLCLL